jgi:hypothetical protein
LRILVGHSLDPKMMGERRRTIRGHTYIFCNDDRHKIEKDEKGCEFGIYFYSKGLVVGSPTGRRVTQATRY